MTSKPSHRKETVKCVTCGRDFEAAVWICHDGTELPPDTLCRECQQEKRRQEEIERCKKELEEVRELQRNRWYEEYGVSGLFIEKTFDNFKHELQPKAFNAVKGFKDHFPGAALTRCLWGRENTPGLRSS